MSNMVFTSIGPVRTHQQLAKLQLDASMSGPDHGLDRHMNGSAVQAQHLKILR